MSTQVHNKMQNAGTIPSVGDVEGKLASIWGNGALEDEDKYRDVMLGLIGEAYHSAVQLDYSRAEHVRRILEWTRPFCRREPLASAYDLGQQLFGVLMAEVAANLHRWRRAYRCIAKVQRVLAAADTRRYAAKVRLRPNSETRWCCLRVLAECKWQEPEESRDHLMTPEQIIDDFYRHDRDARDHLDRHPRQSAARTGRLMQSLAWTNYVVAKMALRYEPRRVMSLVDYFNRRNGSSLAVATGHFRKNKPIGGDNHWYWGFELAKLHIVGKLTPADFEHCQCKWALTKGASEYSQLGQLGAELTHRLMQRNCHRDIEVMPGA